MSSVISAICSRDLACPKLKLVAKSIMDINAASTSFVDEHDFERMLPVLNSLGADSQTPGSWLDVSKVDSEEIKRLGSKRVFNGTRFLLPFLNTCFHYMYDSDGVISRAANKALRSLVETSSELASEINETEDMQKNEWVKLVETTIVPCLKTGIMTKDIAPRRSFILLLSCVARNFDGCKSVHLYGDLKCLIRDDDQDLDFFLNITHVQLHRRARALKRLRGLLSTESKPTFSDQSLGNVLLPLAMHPVYEYQSKTEEAYTIEAIATVGEVCRHLPWSKYNSTLQSLLNNLERYPTQERFLIATVCSILDAFHFTVDTGEGSDDAEGAKAQGNGVSSIPPKTIPFILVREPQMLTSAALARCGDH